MTTGNQETTRTNAAPRRRLRDDNDGYLGGAPILLNLPSLCGVPDVEEPEHHDASDRLDQIANPSTDAEDPTLHPDYAASPTSTLATPEFTESSASVKPGLDADDHTSSSIANGEVDERMESDERIDSDERIACDERIESDEDLIDQAAPKSTSIHRKIILGTSLFVLVTVIYMFANRGPNSRPPAATPAVDIEMGWETADDMFSETTGNSSFVEPAYGSEFDTQIITPPLSQSPAAASEPQTTASTAPLPAVSEATSGDFDMQRVGLTSDYPTTATPDAAYVAETPENTRDSMQNDAGNGQPSPDATRR